MFFFFHIYSLRIISWSLKVDFSLCLVRYYDVVIRRILLKDTLIVSVGAFLFTLNQFFV